MLRPIDISGAWYACAFPDGAYACIRPGARQVQTHLGNINYPPGDEPLFVDVTTIGGFKIIGQGHNTPATWEYVNGHWNAQGLPSACGAFPVIYDLLGQHHISDCSIGSQGWRYIEHDGSPTGKLITGTATAPTQRGLAEWTQIAPDLFIGQGNAGIEGCLVWDRGDTRVLEYGSCFAIRARWDDAGNIGIACYEGTTGHLWFGQISDLRTLPLAETPPIFFPVSHPLTVAVFKDPSRLTGQPVIDHNDLGIFTEINAPVHRIPNTRVIYLQDSPGLPVIPSWLMPWDTFMLQCYPVAGETTNQSLTRWLTNAHALLSLWPGDLAINAAFYCLGGAPPNELFPVSHILDLLQDPLHEVIELSPRFKVLGAFAYDRENGMTTHPELLSAFHSWIAASPGPAVLTQVPAPKPPPKPVPSPEETIVMASQIKDVIHYIAKHPSSQTGCTLYDVLSYTDRDGKPLVPAPQAVRFSVQPDGAEGVRPLDSDGAYEQGQESGNLATFAPTGKNQLTQVYTFIMVPVDKLQS